MDTFVFIAIGEFLILLLFAGMASYWMSRIRRMLNDRNIQIAHLRRKLADISQPTNHTTNPGINFELRAQLLRTEQLLAYYSRRVANLERFRRLYFDLESRMDQQLLATAEIAAETPIDEAAQFRQIDEMQASLDAAARQLSAEKHGKSELYALIDSLQRGTESLRQQLQFAKNQRRLAEQSLLELKRYKMRAETLETKAVHLQQELAAHRARLPEVSPHPLAALEQLQQQLQDKDREIRHLKIECDTVATQYEELATQHVAGASDAQMTEMKRLLDEHRAALTRKQAEIDMLENYCMELEETSTDTKGAGAVATPTPVTIGAVADSDSSNDVQTQRLHDYEMQLQTLTEDYLALQEQFIEVAEEDRQLKQDMEELRLANEHLLAQLNAQHSTTAES